VLHDALALGLPRLASVAEGDLHRDLVLPHELVADGAADLGHDVLLRRNTLGFFDAVGHGDIVRRVPSGAVRATMVLLALIAGSALAGCGEDTIGGPTATPSTAATNSGCVTPTGANAFTGGSSKSTQPDGLIIEDFKVGTGPEPTSGQNVTVNYTGWLCSGGAPFDSSYSRNQPFSFAIGQGAVIKGWDEGVATMKAGGERRLIIPGALAYGAAGSPPKIGPNAKLVFDITLVSIG
jgi:peptidylprolyl isomerase